ncbi:MAG: tRNA pseudouridine(38-40) synthase TruA [Deltaproteobacteria bacterium]|nr:MAG: tRNA pseudouridine(38-40) synthase TruA [Deltaproteobacteria bacterium]
MRTLKLIIQYQGAQFSGWQIQPEKRTVQGVVQEILRKILDESVDLVGSSRTDAGVHALGQVAHIKTKSRMPMAKLHHALKRMLPNDISVIKISEERETFHSQKSTKKKTYRYWVWNSSIGHPQLAWMSWQIPTPLNILKMKKAARYLVGTHDFMAFRAADASTKTSVRTIYKIRFRSQLKNTWAFSFFGKISGQFFCIEFTGSGFLKNMIRNIMGTLVDVGREKIPPEEMKKILLSKDRRNAGMKVPAQGLFLVKIDY